MDATAVAHAQLVRMRGMNAAYHDRFFSDIRFSILSVIGLFVAGAAIDRRLYLVIPAVALIGACQTAFDASYLIFSRQYATRLEQYINRRIGDEVLVAHRLEDDYLFPLNTPKAVTVGLDRFSWFGFMTVLYTALGIGAYVAGLVASLDVIGDEVGVTVGGIYLIVLSLLTVAALATGLWWFPAGEGERRLTRILDSAFAPDPSA